MKKILMTSTALVAAGMLSAGAASAAEKIKINVGGFSKWWVVGAWQDKGFQNGTTGTIGASANGASAAGSQRQNVDVKGFNQLEFSGSTALDNGLKVGVMFTVMAGGHSDSVTDVIDNSFAWVEGGFGKVLAGIHNNGTALLHVQAPDAANNFGSGGVMLGNWAITKPAGVMGMNQRVGYTVSANSTQALADDKAEKLTYVAPSFYGLTLGASYIPNVVRTGAGVGATSLGAHSRANGTDRLGAWGGGALYANTFGPVGVKASAGYVWVDLTATGGAEKALTQQTYGAQLSYAGFTLGGSVQRASDDRKQGGVTSAVLSGTSQAGTYGGKGGSGGDLDFGGIAYDVGLQYASGPYAVSLAYFKSSVVGLSNTTLRNGKDDTIEAYQVSGKYNLGPGVDVLASVGWIEYKDQRDGLAGLTANQNSMYSNSGWTAMTGLSLTF
ncbi:Porin 41 (Por41) precursor [Paramagnetospirillum magnetotacticum MS-1]|uniref:Porin 41 (Por41) n=1 Tax=Paramagnetospirillum magnetotacticum MS-1 TaxID=272627 RepID=A0A0C2U8L7_PARME|nr:porin [Paramagnetospirillum magnetotacticum]KIL97842.1 Porin 41 (Por41) precursor [Paramagnetospirillum magnetotacticum MS-1]